MEDILTTTTIEDLPEDVVLFHILSALPTLDAISISKLVRSWRNLWHEVPGLCFDIIPFYEKSSPPFSHARNSFSDFVGQTFSLLPTHRPLQYFRLAFHHADYGRREPEVRSWIRRAVERGISKLAIQLYQDLGMRVGLPMWGSFDWWLRSVDFDKTFEFCFFDIMNSSVTEVQLCNCGISFPTNVSVAAGFESLKKLVIRHVRLMKTHEIERLLSVCVNLEILNLDTVQYLLGDEFRIHLKRLKRLTLKDYYFRFDMDDHAAVVLMDIDTPELVSLTVDNFCVGFSSMRINVPSLVEADFNLYSGYSENTEFWHSLIMSFQNVERLRLHLLNMSSFPWNTLATFSYLKNLELVTGFFEDELLSILGILKSSPLLESVIIDSLACYFDCFDVDDKLDNKFVDLKIPRLREITIKNYRNTRNELYLVDWIKRNNVMLNRIVAVPPKHTGDSPIVLWEAKETTLIEKVQEDLEHITIEDASQAL